MNLFNIGLRNTVFKHSNFSPSKLLSKPKHLAYISYLSIFLSTTPLYLTAQNFDGTEISAIPVEEKPSYNIHLRESKAEGFVISRIYHYIANTTNVNHNQGFKFNVDNAQLSHEIINESEAKPYLPAGEYWVVALKSKRIRFVKEGNEFKVFKKAQSHYRLSQEGNGWLLKKGSVSYRLDSSGRLIEYQNKTSHRTYTYTGLTTTIQGFNDSEKALWQMQLEKDVDGRVVGLVTPQGIEKRYEYDGEGRLVAAVYADNTEGWHDNPRELYLYEDSAHPNLLTQVISPLKDVLLNMSLVEVADNRLALRVQELPKRAPRPRKSPAQESAAQTTTSWANGVNLIVKNSERSYQHNGQYISKEKADELLKDIRHYWVKHVVHYGAGGCNCTHARGSIRREESRENGWRRQVINEWSDGRKQVTDYTKENNGIGFLKSITLTQGNTLLSQKIYTGTRESRLLSEETSVLKTDYKYDVEGRLIQTTQIDKTNNNTESITLTRNYDNKGRLISSYGARASTSDQINYLYNEEGHLIQKTNVLGHVVNYEYDKQGRRTAVIDGNGVREETHYGNNGKVAKVIRAAGTSQALTTHYFYDAIGQLVQTLTGTLKGTKSQFDAYGRLESTEDASGNTTLFHYDKQGNLVERTTKSQQGKIIQQTEREFDAQGREILNKSSNTQLDYLGDSQRPTKIINGEGNQVLNQYDSEGRLLISFDANEQPTYYDYDDMGNLVKVTDARRIETRYSYDGFGRRLSEISGSKGTITYQYDTAGNIVKETRENGIVIKRDYDVLNRMTKIVFLKKETGSSGKNKSVEKKRIIFKYDNCINGVGKLCVVKGAGSTTRYDYDVLEGRPSSWKNSPNVG